MTTNNSIKDTLRSLIGTLASCVVIASAHGGPTALGTEPFTSTTKVNALPNVMFVLDDSGSMQADFLPDWAGPYQQTISSVLTTVTPPHRFFNGIYNGVAYNPGTRYRAPVMYTNTGALDTTTYPSQTGESVAQGGDGAATTLARNWRAVKVDGYGIQSTSTANLEGNAFSYTTLAGEHCTTGQLRTCTASAVPTGSYIFPASLRWCTTSLLSVDTTVNSNGVCQASNIANTPTNTANGVTNYTFPRMPRPRTATITLPIAGGTVSGITVDALQILAGSATGSSDSALAAAIVTQVNACTLTKPSPCMVVGYSAVSLGGVVTLTAPGVTSSNPVVTGVTASTSAFSGSSVPGETVLSVITPSVTSYAFPGSATKGSNRSDCAGTTCTYNEEMTNYANWYAYYRTRMQMMKTASSIAFSAVDNTYRVGFYSINNGLNGAGSYFINPSAFDGAQKNLWYSKFFSAVPYGATPLRTGLANTGRLYAGKLSTLNSVAVIDPIQYSCQQNFTILSTDGYWNDANNPKQIDGTTDIGQQDGSLDRPYFDGGTQTRTVTQTLKSEEQWGTNTILLESRTQQQQTSASRLLETVVTTDTFPWTTQTTALQERTTPLDVTQYNLRSRTYPLTSDTKELQESSFKLNSTPRILQSYINNLTKTTTPLEARTYKVTVGTRLLTKKDYKVTVGTRLLTQKDYKVTVGTKLLTQKDYKVTVGTKLLTKKDYKVTSTASPLQSSTYKLQSSTRQLQKRMETSVDGGDTWQDTGWVNVSSCTTALSGPGYARNTICRYDVAVVAGNLNSCTTVTASPSSPYTVGQAVTCAYETTPTVANVGTCTVVAQSGTFAAPQVACGYGAATAPVSGLLTCTAKNQTGSASMTGDKVVCSYDATPTTTTNLSSCQWKVPSPAASVPKTDCSYQAASNSAGQTACTAVADGTVTTNNTTWNTGVACSYDATPTTTTNLSSCQWKVPSPAASVPKTDCSYQAVSNSAGQTACTAVADGTVTTNNTTWNTGVACSYDATPTTTTNLSSCQWKVPSPAASVPKTDCSYQAVSNSAGQTACTAAAIGTVTTNLTTWNTGVACSYDATPTTTTNLSSCQWKVPSPAASVPKTDCSYQAVSNSAGQTACTAAAIGTVTTNNTTWNTGVACSYDATPTTLTNQSSCTWVVPATAASLPKTDCVYNAGAATTATVASCTAVAQSTGTTNGTVWAGPATACNYQAAILTGTNLTTCTAGTPSGGPVFSAYTTCGYINGTTTTGLNSCTYVADSTGPVNYTGPANACAYATTAVVTNVASCTPVAQSGTFAAPQKTCAYQTVGTAASNLASCTDQAQSSGAYPWVGPNVSCAYSGTASSDQTVASCTIHDSGGSPYTGGAKVRCTYRAGVTTNNVASCNAVTKIASTADGTVFSGPAYDCTYGSTSGWSNSTAACVDVAQSVASPYIGPAKDCQYTSPSVDTLTATCTPVAQDKTNLTAVNCVPGAFPSTVSTVATVVDTCSTAPTSSGSPTVRSTATSCVYQPVVTSNTPSCAPAPASVSSPFTTAITCPVSDTGYVPLGQTVVGVMPTCTPAGNPSPASFDGFGKIVECRTTDFTPYTVTYPSGLVPVASCTPGLTEDGALRQTNCAQLVPFPTGPTPVDPATCSTALPVAGNSFINTTCTSTSTSSTVMGCSAPPATSPLWETVTCTNNAGTGTSDTLADVAAYYYYTDLRTPALNNCVGAVVSPATAGSTLCTTTDAMNNVGTTTSDPASWQHMSTFTLGLGASGYMKYSDSYPTDTSGDFTTVKGVSPFAPANGIAADPANGVCSWQASGNCNWPYPASNEQTTIDDLWHAGVNGHGAYFSATDPDSLSNSIATALSGVAAAGGAAGAPSISTPSLSPADNYVFSSTFTTLDWTGELVRKQIDPFSGAVSTTNDWAVQGKLDAKLASARNIYTFDASVATTKLKAFTSANFATDSYFNSPHISTSPSGLTQFLCASTDICLSATDQDTSHAAGANLVNYLRGERTNEGAESNNTKYYRQRQHVLGDLVNAQVVYVHKPLYNYSDAGYSAFVTAQSSRQAVAYAGSNDGMLHAFAAKGNSITEALVDAAAAASAASSLDPTDAGLATVAATKVAAANTAIAADTTVGQELWAYIPTMVMPNLYQLADKKYKGKHRYYVDSTPVVGDICTSNCSLSTAVWKTVLVGGLGRGGRGYYALDITDPANPKALWEFTDTNLGYTYGNPQIAKLSNGTWVVMMTSGYNNIPNDDGAGGDGVGRLYVLNAATGVPISGVSPISTGTGSVASPSGLAKITAQVINPSSDNTVEAVYGGDLNGNLWRFDVNDTLGSTTSGYDAQLLAALMDGAGNSQPITTKPEIGLIQNEKVIFVGTGRYLAASDASDTSQQSLYAIKDARSTTTTPSTAIFNNPGGSPRTTGTSTEGFVRQIQSVIPCPSGTLASICAQGANVITSTNNPVNFLSENGWFIDLLATSERANTDPALALGLLAFNTNAPSLLACDVGGKSYSYFLDYLTGGPIYSPGNGTPASNNGVVGMLLANQLASSPSLAVTKSGKLIIISGLSGGGINVGQPPLPPPASVTRRTSWRELIRGN
jgi:Tfp pilus tip-associated adhesin PilY1